MTLPLFENLMAVFNSVVEHIAECEKSGPGISPDFFIPGCEQDKILRTHIHLAGTNQTYHDLYEAFKSAHTELEAMVDELPEDELAALVSNILDDKAIKVPDAATALDQKITQYQTAMFAIHQGAKIA